MKASLAPHRLRAQRLVGEPLASPAEVIGHLGAVQSQLPDMALWGIGRRCAATLSEVEAAFEGGEFVRTHVLRPTWHDVLRTDLQDLLELTAPRIRQAMASNNRRDGLERDVIERWAGLAVEAIRADGPLTRLEVEQRLTEAGFARQGNSLAHIMIEAELTGEIHSGPVRGRQHTYVGANLPRSRRTPDERLAWLATTYGRGHGPFRIKDLAWWSTLTLTQARQAVELAGLTAVELADETHWLVEDVDTVAVPRVMLLANFDEYISYARDPDDYAGIEGDIGSFLRATGLVFINGAVAGSWTRKLTSASVSIDVTVAKPIGMAIQREIEVEAERFGAFVNRPISCMTHALG